MCRWLDTAGKTVFHWLKSIWHDLQLIEKLVADSQFSVRLAISVDNYERLVYENVSCKWLLMRDSWSSVINLHLHPWLRKFLADTLRLLINWEISQNIQKSRWGLKYVCATITSVRPSTDRKVDHILVEDSSDGLTFAICNHHLCEATYYRRR